LLQRLGLALENETASDIRRRTGVSGSRAHYIDSTATDPAAALQALGGAKVVLITASGGKTVAATFKGLRPGGVAIDLGVGPELSRHLDQTIADAATNNLS